VSHFGRKVGLRDLPQSIQGVVMYKVEIKIGDGWGFDDEELLVIQTTDFEKAQIIQEFIEFQKDHGWAVEYGVVTEDDEEYEYDEDEISEDEESEEFEIGETVEDEDGLVWERVA
jgi:hypothetical protein